MELIKRHRIKFYSKENLAVPYQLKNAEELLDNIKLNISFSLNDLLEFYNIKLYLDNELYLTSWTINIISSYKGIVEKIWAILKHRLIQINDNNFENEISLLEFDYWEDFWTLIDNLSIYKKISSPKFIDALNKNERQISCILTQKGIVGKFDIDLKDFLLKYKKSAEILLSKFEEKQSFNGYCQYYFPKSLSLEESQAVK